MIAPKLRFKADDGSAFPDWEEKKINDIATCFAGATPSTKIPEYWEDGTIQWMSSGEVNNGQIFETEKRISKLGFDKCSTKMVKPNTVVIALAGQGKTRGMVAITRTSLCTNQSLCAIETNTDICDDYLYQYLQLQYNNLRLISSGDGTRGGLNLKLIGNYSVSIPSLSEQQKIADFLSTIDTIIEKQRAMISAWEERKKGVIQKLFSQEVRFKADDGSDFPDWEEKRLGDVFEERTERSVGGEELLSVTISQGVIRQSDSDKRNNSSENKSNYKVVKKNDLAYNTMRMWQGAEGVSDFDGIVSPAYTVVTPLDGNNGKYFEIFFKQISMLHLFQRYSQGLTSDTWNLKFPSFAKIKCCVPCEKEQNKIVNCIVLLDTVIQKQKETLEKWQELKKGLLQQMFV